MEQKMKTSVAAYLKSPQLSFIEELLVEVAKEGPTHPIQFCIDWLQCLQEKKNQKQAECESEEEEQEKPFEEHEKKMIRKMQDRKLRRVSRQGVSSEVFGQYNKKEQYNPKIVEKQEESKVLLASLLKKSIFFQTLSHQDQKLLIDSVEEVHAQEGDMVITEGQTGNLLYIVESGVYECTKNINGAQTYLKDYESGDIFGELALLYNAPRAASIQCKTKGKLFTLDRVTFNMVMTGAASKRRTHFYQTLKKIQMFSAFSDEEKDQICDVLKEEKFKAGETVIQQGEKGEKFYIIHSGMLLAEKIEENSCAPKVVYQYRAGDYFGELALMHDLCRQATVKTISDCILFSIDRDSFMRLMGSANDIMERNKQKYSNFQNSEVPPCC